MVSGCERRSCCLDDDSIVAADGFVWVSAEVRLAGQELGRLSCSQPALLEGMIKIDADRGHRPLMSDEATRRLRRACGCASGCL